MSHRPPSHDSSCFGKAKLTYSQAAKSAKNMTRRTDETLRPYHCRYCGYFHMGGTVRNLDKRKEQRYRDRGDEDYE